MNSGPTHCKSRNIKKYFNSFLKALFKIATDFLEFFLSFLLFFQVFKSKSFVVPFKYKIKTKLEKILNSIK